MAITKCIIGDGTTDIEVLYPDEKHIYNLDKTTRLSSGGRLKSQVSGRRIKLTVEARVTIEIYNQILNMLENQSLTYYYTPSEIWQGLYPTVTLPFEANFTLQDPVYQSPSIVYMRIDVESVLRIKDI